MNSPLHLLVKRYVDDVNRAEEIMKKEWSIEQPMLFRRHGIPRTGKVGKNKYAFHGIGCYFEFEDRFVDYDYGEEDRIDGFDLWRLERYGEQFKEFKEYVKTGTLASDFESAIKEGTVRKSFEEHDDLYYKTQEYNKTRDQIAGTRGATD